MFVSVKQCITVSKDQKDEKSSNLRRGKSQINSKEDY